MNHQSWECFYCWHGPFTLVTSNSEDLAPLWCIIPFNMKHTVRGSKKSQTAKCDVAKSDSANKKEDSNFGTKSFYGKKGKTSAQDVSENGAENVLPVVNQTENSDFNDIANISVSELDLNQSNVSFVNVFSSSFVDQEVLENDCESSILNNGANNDCESINLNNTVNVDNTVMIIDQVCDMRIQQDLRQENGDVNETKQDLKKRKRPELNYCEVIAGNEPEFSDSDGSDSEFVPPVAKKPRQDSENVVLQATNKVLRVLNTYIVV